MRRALVSLLAVNLFVLSAWMVRADNWPGWRGPRGDGTSRETNIPTRWDAASGKNILWHAAIPGTGHSSPIVWNNAVFVTACDEADGARLLMRFDSESGKLVWKINVMQAPLEKRHKLNSYASGTPATDGKLVYVTFLDADFSSASSVTPGDLVVSAYDFDGNQQWTVKPGRFSSVHGFCSSPVLFEDKVIVNGDHDGDGYLVALSRETGEKVWRVARPNQTRSYVTPIIRDMAGRTQMILSGSKCVTSYDPRTGEQLWYLPGPTEQFVASLVDNGKLLFLTAGFPDRHILALKPDGSGNLGDDAIVWRTTKNCSYVPSPIICGTYFLVVSDNGVASCYDSDSGTLHWNKRLDTMNHSASLVTTGGLVYFLADNGVMRVVRPGPEFELVAENSVGEDCYASPAISNGRLFLRSRTKLYCISNVGTAG
jgi:outer membrane protein assembly factor BamB